MTVAQDDNQRLSGVWGRAEGGFGRKTRLGVSARSGGVLSRSVSTSQTDSPISAMGRSRESLAKSVESRHAT